MRAALPADYHTHNHLCKHAEGTCRDYARAAGRSGPIEIAATDHCPTDDGYGIEHRMAIGQFASYLDLVAEARRVDGVTVLLGVEADYYDGCETFLAPFLDRHPFDIVLGSVHFIDYWAGRGVADHSDPDATWKDYFQCVARLADTRLFDVAAHLDLPKKFGLPIGGERLRELALPALDRIAKAGMAIEINTSGRLHLPASFYPSAPILEWAAERGIGLTFGSDAHSPGRVADGFADAVSLARQAGFRTWRRYRGRNWEEVPLPVHCSD